MVRAAGPWRLEAEWWSPAPIDRDYYDVEAADGTLYRVFHERDRGWFVDGVYD